MPVYKDYDKKTLKKLQEIEIEMLKDINYICEKYNINYFALDGTGLGAIRHKGFIPWDDDIDLRMLEEDAIKFKKCMEKEMGDKYYFIDQNNGIYPISFIKMCKRNTIFMDDAAYELDYENLGIFVDLIILVYVSDDEEERRKKLKKSWYLYKLGILAAIKEPTIKYKGFKGILMKTFFRTIHYILKIFNIKYNKIYERAMKISKVNKKTNTVAYLNSSKLYGVVHNINDIYPVKKKKFADTYVYVPKEFNKLLTESFGDYMKLPKEEDRHNHYPHKLIFDLNKIEK